MQQLAIRSGQEVHYQGRVFLIKRVVDLSTVLAEDIESKELQRLSINNLTALQENVESAPPVIDAIDEEDWQIAESRFLIIRPILEAGGGSRIVTKVANESNIDRSTLYRWINRYQTTGSISALVPSERLGGKGKSRLDEKVEVIVSSVIEDSYLTPQKKTSQKIYQEIVIKCKNAGLEPPAVQTIRSRIASIPEFIKLKGRYGRKAMQEKFNPIRASFPGADFPLSVIQIDHTKLDIVLVDEIYRIPVGRPWITLAIDVYSRMIAGFHISFDPPGELATGACISNAILPKDKLLAKHDLSGEWPCWGIMKTIHADNAKEFKGSMLKRACSEYGIELSWRPVATPHWGGHIERLVGTIVREIHALPGTTFANYKERKNYNSEKRAVLTLKELEKWLLIFITDVYHKREHKGISTSPLMKYTEGIFGSNNQPGVGLPNRILDDRKVKLDFLPYKERSIQEYGVMLGNIHYYHDVLRRWINSTDSKNPDVKRKFIFKIDPRDITIVYFYDPELKEYFAIPTRDTSRAAMSIWEYRAVVDKLKESGRIKINEDDIFQALEKMREIEYKAVTNTKKTRRKAPRSIDRKSIHSDVKVEPAMNETTIPDKVNKKSFKPFEDIDDGTFE